MKFSFPLAVASFAAAFLATLTARGWWVVPDPAPRPAVAPSGDAAKRAPLAPVVTPKPATDPELEGLRREIAERRKRAGILTTEEALARVEQLKTKIAPLYESGDGEGLMRLMREIAAVGPEGYAAALQVLRTFEEQPPGTEYAFGLNLAWFREHAYGGPMVPMLNWALAMPDLAPPWFRKIAAEKLPGRAGWDPGRSARLLGWLKVEDDDAIAAALGRGLLSAGEPPPLEDLLEAARRADGPGARQAALRAALLGDSGTEARKFLGEFADGGDAGVREEARLWLDSPPQRVAAVVRVAPASRAADIGLRPGDVVLAVENKRVLDPATFELAMDRAAEKLKWPVVLVVRDGKPMKIVVRQRHRDRNDAPLGLSTRPEGFAR